MSENQSQPIGSQQLPSCQICHLQPSPESSQYYPFIVLQLFLLFYSLKLAVVIFFASYCFSKTKWLCPQCKRQVQIGFQIEGSNENIILRMGNCMFMLSKNKFRIIASVIIGYLLYLFAVEMSQRPKYTLQKSWKSLISNCGYDAYLQNSFRANTFYSQYPKLGEWTIEGVFLRQLSNPQRELTRVFIKMNPTQFKNNMTEDVVVYQTGQTHLNHESREVGDVLKLSGQWEGRQGEGHLFRFVATKIQKTGQKISLDHIMLFGSVAKFISVHDQQQKIVQRTKNLNVNSTSEVKN